MSTTLKCANCQDIITSSGYRHNFILCKCKNCFVDGGDDYSRYGGNHFFILNNKTKEWEEVDFSKKSEK